MFKGHRTRILALLVTFVGVVELYEGDTIRQMVPEQYQGATFIVVGILIAVLRQMTTTAPGKSA
jgi:hypothetical protein